MTLLLLVCALTDVKCRKIWWPPAAAAAAAGFVMHLAVPGMAVTESLFGLLPGMVLIALSIVTGRAVGLGDGLVLCAYGSMLGLRSVCDTFFAALAAAAVWAVVLLLRRRANRHTRLAFMPFLLLAHLVLLLW